MDYQISLLDACVRLNPGHGLLRLVMFLLLSHGIGVSVSSSSVPCAELPPWQF